MLAALQTRLSAMDGGWVIELDIRSYFDTIDHGLLRRCVQRRVRDGVLLRLLCKWLRAGVLESGRWSAPESGTPQGGVISPLLANIYLHEVLDQGFATEVQPRLSGRSFLLRYADDAMLVFANQADARRALFGSMLPLANPCLGAGCVNRARPDLWGAGQVTARSTRRAAAQRLAGACWPQRA